MSETAPQVTMGGEGSRKLGAHGCPGPSVRAHSGAASCRRMGEAAEAQSLSRQLRNEGKMGHEVQWSRKGWVGMVTEGQGLTGLGIEGRMRKGWDGFKTCLKKGMRAAGLSLGNFPCLHLVIAPLRTGTQEQERWQARKGFQVACARLRLACPRQPSSHTQEATGCLDLEQGSGQRNRQECPTATGREGRRWKSAVWRTEEPTGRAEAWERQAAAEGQCQTTSRSSQSQIQPRTKTLKPKNRKERKKD